MNPSFCSSQYIASARFGALTPYIHPYIALVTQEGYQRTTIVGHLRLIGRLHRWLRRRGHELREFDEPLLERFLKSQSRKRRTHANGDSVTLQRLLVVLREANVISPARKSFVPSTSGQRLTDRYRRFLLDERGLAESTVDNYVWHVGQFLAGQFGRDAVSPVRLQAEDAIAFIRRTSRGHSTQHAKNLVAALRAFFRFLHYQGKIKSDLASALPTVAGWALATLPKYISADAIQRVLDQCDQRTAIGPARTARR